MNVVRCDHPDCEETRPADDVTPHSWLHLEQPHRLRWTVGAASWDFCSALHLADWARTKVEVTR